MSLFLRSRRSYATFFTTIACLSVPAGWADHKSNTIAELRAQLEALTARLESLEAQQQQTQVAVKANSVDVAATKACPNRRSRQTRVPPRKLQNRN